MQRVIPPDSQSLRTIDESVRSGVIPPTPEKPNTPEKSAPRRFDSKERHPKKVHPTPPPKNLKTPCWLTRAMAEDFTRQDVLVTTFREALLYMMFVIAVTLGTLGRRTFMFYYQTEALKGQFIHKHFHTLNDVEITFPQITSVADFWFYVETSLLDSLYWKKYYSNTDETAVQVAVKDDQNILFENHVLGVPRIRQVKVRNDSCIIHGYFKRFFRNCYDVYREADSDQGSFGPAEGTAWVYSLENETESVAYEGRISTYEGGGFYQDFPPDKEESAAMLGSLKDNSWITRGTRVIFIDFSTYNANLDVFSICKLVFEFPPTGGIMPSHQFNSVKFLKNRSYDRISFGFECALYVIAAIYVLEEIREIIYFKFRYFLQFWTYIDLIIISLSFANFVNSFIVFPNADPTIKEILENPTKYGNLEYLGSVKSFYNTFAASLLFFTYVKVFKYLSFNKTMGQLNNTLKNSALDIVGFTVMFVIIFFAFAELGYLFFGAQVVDFRSFGVSMFTLLRAILGDIEYAEIERANRILAPIYVLSYIFFVFFVLLNMFLAIINDTYADVKTEIVIGREEMQMSEYLKNRFFAILKKCGCNFKWQKSAAEEFKATIEQIKGALLNCGFSDLEIAMFFAQYNIDIQDESGNYDVKAIMMEMEKFSAINDMDETSTLVNVSDFLIAQDRFDRIEQSIRDIGVKIDGLVAKLDFIASFRKTSAPRG